MKQLTEKGAIDLMLAAAILIFILSSGYFLSRVINNNDDGAVDVVASETEDRPIEQVDDESTPEPDRGLLVLEAEETATGIALSWKNNGLDAPDGYKIVYSATSDTPEYRDSDSHFVVAGSTSTVLDVGDGRNYTFRICVHRSDDGRCNDYSNAAVAGAPQYDEENVVAGEIETQLSIEGNKIEWAITGTAPNGFRVLMSTSKAPKYPADNIQHASSGVATAELPKEIDETYYVRVCKYTGDASIKGGCTDYSNQVEYVIGEQD